MSQREAFEAFCRKGDQEVGEMLDRDEVGYTNLVVAACYETWQSAIQHARDVAVKTCEEEKVEVAVNNGKYSDGDVGYNTACTHCADAIKEALGPDPETPGNKGTTPNS